MLLRRWNHQYTISTLSSSTAISVLPAPGQASGGSVSCDLLLTRRLRWSYMATAPQPSSPLLLPPPAPPNPWLTWRLPDLRPSPRPAPPPTWVHDCPHWHQGPLLATRHGVDRLPLWPHNICMIIYLGLTRRKAWKKLASLSEPARARLRLQSSNCFFRFLLDDFASVISWSWLKKEVFLRAPPPLSLPLPFPHHLRHLALPDLPGPFFRCYCDSQSFDLWNTRQKTVGMRVLVP